MYRHISCTSAVDRRRPSPLNELLRSLVFNNAINLNDIKQTHVQCESLLAEHIDFRRGMGQVFGFNGANEPAYSTLWQQPPYQIRRYDAYVVAEVSMNERGTVRSTENGAFMSLASYIGVFRAPENKSSKLNGSTGFAVQL